MPLVAFSVIPMPTWSDYSHHNATVGEFDNGATSDRATVMMPQWGYRRFQMKRNMKRIVSFGLVCMLMSLAGCGTRKPQTMTLSLDSNPTTGYSWTATQDTELFDISDEYIENQHEDGMVGVGGRQVFTLEPKASGTTDVIFTYARSWEEPSEDDTTVSYTVAISKDMQIKVDAARFAGGDDMNSLPQIPDPEIN